MHRSALATLFLVGGSQWACAQDYMMDPVISEPAKGQAKEYLMVGGEAFKDNWVSSVSLLVVSRAQGSNASVSLRLTGLHANVHGTETIAENTQLEESEISEDYTRYSALEAGIGLRIGGPVYMFLEYGQDLGETAIAMLLSDDDDEDGENDGIQIDIDRSFTAGAGVVLGPLTVQGFTRYRHISGLYANTQQHWFRGVELGYRF